jgi:exonuclease III
MMTVIISGLFFAPLLLLSLLMSVLPSMAAAPPMVGIPVTSFVTCNINSLSLNDPGGLAGRKHAAMNTVTTLARSHDVVCVQDVRAGADDYAAELRSALPRFGIVFNSNSRKRGGVMTIVSPRWAAHASHKKIIENHVLSTTIIDPNNARSQITFFNCYLNPTNQDQAWTKQVRTLGKAALPTNSVVLGDFNHAPDGEDRSSSYMDRTEEARVLFQKMLEGHSLSEVPQIMHTFYRYHGHTDSLISSRIDRIYVNFTYTTLMKHHPEAHVYTSAPNTLCRYRKAADWSSSCGKNSDWAEPTLQDRQLVASFPKANEGATHITDHLPIAVRLSDMSAAISDSPARISKAIYDHPDFASIFMEIWLASLRPSNPWARARQLKRTIHLTAKKIRKLGQCVERGKDGNDDIRIAIKILNDSGNISHSHLCDRYPDLPHLTTLAENGATGLLEYINNELAVRAVDKDTSLPISKLDIQGHNAG